MNCINSNLAELPSTNKVNREDAKNAKIFNFFLSGLSVLAVQISFLAAGGLAGLGIYASTSTKIVDLKIDSRMEQNTDKK